MLSLLVSLTIVAVVPAGAQPAADADAVQVFACDFEAGDKLGPDRIPAGWTRRFDVQFPHYLPIKLTGDAAAGGACLQFELDGGAAELRSPHVPLDDRYAYVVEAQIRTQGLQHDAGFVSLAMFARDGRQLRQVNSTPVTGTAGWTRVRIGPVAAGEARWATVGLHLQSQAADPFAEFDLHGSAWFDALRMVRVPRVELSTTDTLHLYSLGDEVSVSCLVTGAAHRPVFSLRLDDAREPARASVQPVEAQPSGAEDERWAWTWRHRFQRPGFYQLCVSRIADGRAVDERRVPLAVVDVLPAHTGGNFGWSLPALDDSVLASRHLRLLEEARVAWIKVPLLIQADDSAGHRRAVEMIESLRRRQIAIVGVLAGPEAKSARQPPQPAAQWFADLDEAQAQALTSTLARYGLQVSAWQVGRDGDMSFASASDPAAAWKAVTQRMRRVAGDVEIGTSWPTAAGRRSLDRPPWQLVCLARERGESDGELTARLAKLRSQGADCMLSLETAADGGSPLEQAASLVHRMMVAKLGGARFIGFQNPLDPANGLIDATGACQPRFLAWRTAAWAIGPGQHAGSFELPGGSRCEVFLDNGRPILVVSNAEPTQEKLYLGPAAEIIDVLGCRAKLPTSGGQQSFDAHRLPQFISGADAEIARWRIASRLEQEQFPSEFGLKRPDALHITNTFAAAAAGVVTISPPPGWKVHPPRIEFKLAAGEQARLPFELFIPLAGTTGPELLRFEFDIGGQPRRQFEVFHRLRLEDEHLRLAVRSAINAAGELEVTQRCENKSSEPVSLRCNLFAPGERRLRWQVSNLAAGSEVHIYRLPEGERFRGETLWLRAEEIGGSRVLSCRFTVDGMGQKGPRQRSTPGDRTARALW